MLQRLNFGQDLLVVLSTSLFKRLFGNTTPLLRELKMDLKVVAAGGFQWISLKRERTRRSFFQRQALKMRLVTEVVETGQTLSRAIEYAERVAKAAPLAIKATLQSAFHAQDEGDDAALSKLNEQLLTLIQSEDIREGVMAMMQKREPVFKGR